MMRNLGFNRVAPLAALAIIAAGCVHTQTEVEEPIINQEAAAPEMTYEQIRLIEREDVSGRVTAAREAANKLINDARQRAKDLTRDTETIYARKEMEAQANAEKILEDARKQAAEEKQTILKDTLADKVAEADKQVAALIEEAKKDIAALHKEKTAKMDEVVQHEKARGEKIAEGIIDNAKKSAADIVAHASGKLADADKKAAEKIKEADGYLEKKIADADKELLKIEAEHREKLGKGLASDPEEEKLAKQMVKTIIKAIETDDYETFSKDFSDDHKERLTKDKFATITKNINENLGKFGDIHYLGTLKKGVLTVYMWKASFPKSEESEMMIRLTLGQLDGKTQVFFFDISVF
jgi:vacuolar-type H+-ATPase subunit H